jgi:hypothetical protein
LMASPSSLIKRLKLSSSSKSHHAFHLRHCMIRWKTVSRTTLERCTTSNVGASTAMARAS